MKWVSAEKNATKISPCKKWVCTEKMLLIKLVLVWNWTGQNSNICTCKYNNYPVNPNLITRSF